MGYPELPAYSQEDPPDRFQHRLEDDVLPTCFGERSGYFRTEINRSIDCYAMDFCKDASLLREARKHLEETGSIAVLDVGCGTGQALWSFREYLTRRDDYGPDDRLALVGINIDDFRNEAQGWRARKAIKEGIIDYIVGDARIVTPRQEFDIIFCYEVLIHMSDEDAAAVLRNTERALKPGGSMYFGLHLEQLESETIAEYLRELRGSGEVTGNLIENAFSTTRAFVTFKKAASDH